MQRTSKEKLHIYTSPSELKSHTRHQVQRTTHIDSPSRRAVTLLNHQDPLYSGGVNPRLKLGMSVTLLLHSIDPSLYSKVNGSQILRICPKCILAAYCFHLFLWKRWLHLFANSKHLLSQRLHGLYIGGDCLANSMTSDFSRGRAVYIHSKIS